MRQGNHLIFTEVSVESINRKQKSSDISWMLQSLLFYFSIVVTEHMTKAIHKKKAFNLGLQALKG